MNIYLIRHGETARNLKGNQLIGQSPDEPLTEHGKQQAKLLGENLKRSNIVFDEIYCSPYIRAMDTCKIASAEFTTLRPTIINDLREYGTGTATNKNRADVIDLEMLNKMNYSGMHFHYEGGESLFEVERRASNWLYDALQKHKDTTHTIAAFTHGMVIKCLIHYIMQFDHKLTWKISIDNTSISKFDYKLDHWFVKSINDVSHLRN